jgi:hypothetical protein
MSLALLLDEQGSAPVGVFPPELRRGVVRNSEQADPVSQPGKESRLHSGKKCFSQLENSMDCQRVKEEDREEAVA